MRMACLLVSLSQQDPTSQILRRHCRARRSPTTTRSRTSSAQRCRFRAPSSAAASNSMTMESWQSLVDGQRQCSTRSVDTWYPVHNRDLRSVASSRQLAALVKGVEATKLWLAALPAPQQAWRRLRLQRATAAHTNESLRLINCGLRGLRVSASSPVACQRCCLPQALKSAQCHVSLPN